MVNVWLVHIACFSLNYLLDFLLFLLGPIGHDTSLSRSISLYINT